MYFEEIPVNDFLTLKRKMVDFSIRDLEGISLFLFDKDEDIEWGLHEKTQTFNIGYWSTSTNIDRLIGREVKTSTVTIATTTLTPDVKSTKGQPKKFKLSLFKCEDDWFLAQLFINCEFRYQDEGFWIKIDQIDGVTSFLECLFENCPVWRFVIPINNL